MEFDILNELLTSTVYSLFNTKTQESSIESTTNLTQIKKEFANFKNYQSQIPLTLEDQQDRTLLYQVCQEEAQLILRGEFHLANRFKFG